MFIISAPVLKQMGCFKHFLSWYKKCYLNKCLSIWWNFEGSALCMEGITMWIQEMCCVWASEWFTGTTLHIDNNHRRKWKAIFWISSSNKNCTVIAEKIMSSCFTFISAFCFFFLSYLKQNFALSVTLCNACWCFWFNKHDR